MMKRNCIYLVLIVVTGFMLQACMPAPVTKASTGVATQFYQATATILPTIVPKPLTPTHPPLLETTATPTATTRVHPLLQLTFESDRSGIHGIYAMDVLCIRESELCFGEPYLLFEWDDQFLEVDWSPDGKQVVISGFEGAVFLANGDGAHVREISIEPGRAGSPQWSPDGSRIAYIDMKPAWPGSDMYGPSRIMVYDLKSGQTSQILGDIFEPSEIFWLSDERIACVTQVSESDPSEYIQIVKFNGEVLADIPSNDAKYSSIDNVSISPDGKRLTYVGWVDQPDGIKTDEIFVVDITGGGLTSLTAGLSYSGNPAWMPLGEWIAFDAWENQIYSIYLMRSNGTGRMKLTNDAAKDMNPEWRVVTSP